MGMTLSEDVKCHDCFHTITALDYITIIGGSISIACLTLAVIIFYWVRTLRRDFGFVIHRNLCVNLLIAEILFLAGIEATENSDLCLSIAVFIHFFFLCAFSWMVVEGLYLYFLITKVNTFDVVSDVVRKFGEIITCTRFLMEVD